MDDLQRTLELIKDPDPQVRKYALSQLELIGDAVENEEVLEALRLSTADPDPQVSHQANRSLVIILHRSFGVPVRRDPPVVEKTSERFEGVPFGELRRQGLLWLETPIEILHDIALGDDLSLAKRAVISLAKLGAAASLPVLAETLLKPSLGEVSAVALPELGVEEAIVPLMDVAGGPACPLKAHAVLGLGKFSLPEARSLLLKLVADKSPVVRANVALAIGDLEAGEDLLMPLARLSRDPEVWVVLYALRSLTNLAFEQAFEVICATYHESSDDRVRASCLNALGLRADIKAEQLLVDALEASDDRVRANAVEALGKIGLDGVRLKTLLSPLARDCNNRVRANVALALKDIVPDGALKLVKSLLSSADGWDFASGIYCLGEIRTTETLELLAAVLREQDDEDTLVRAVRALNKRGNETVSPSLVEHLRHPSVPVRASVARALGRFRGDRLFDLLVEHYFNEEEATVRSALVFAIGDQSAMLGKPPWTKALDDRSDRVVADTIESLGAVRSIQVHSFLRPFLKHSNNRIKANTVVALWRAGMPESAEVLSTMLLTPDPGTVRSALYAAGEMGRALRFLDMPETNPLLPSALKRLMEQASMGDDLAGQPAVAAKGNLIEGAVLLEEVIDAYLSSGPKEALSRLNAIAKRNDIMVERSFLSYRFQAELGMATEAFRILESVLELGGLFLTPLLDLANGYSRLRMDAKALTSVLEACKRHQACLAELVDTGLKAVESGKVSDAQQLCRFLLEGRGIGPDFHTVIGRELLGAREFSMAFAHLMRAHITNPGDLALSLDYAYAACRLGAVSLGRRLCEQVLRTGSNDKQSAPVLEKAGKLYALITGKPVSGGE